MAASDPTLKGRLNLDRIGMSGHSFGAISTLAAAGQMMGPKAFERSFAEPRIRAGIAYSPSPRCGARISRMSMGRSAFRCST